MVIFPWQRALLGYICPTSSNLVCNEGQRVSPYSPRQSLALFWRFHQLLLSMATSQLSFRCSDSLLICFIVVGLLLPYLNMPILKAWGSASRAQRPLTTGIVRRQFPWLRGTNWRNNGRSAWNGSRFEHICAFYVETTKNSRGEIENVML